MTDLGQRWLLPPPDLTLPDDEVHVWRASLEQPVERVQRLAGTLSHDERLRAERFRCERDRQRFIVGRGVLRAILGRYLSVEPGQLRFSYGAHGKPSLAAGFDGDALRFNLAHSHALALYACMRGREIGVDLEQVRPLPDAGEIAAGFLSAREKAALEAVPDAGKPEAFFGYWTCKEAYSKATGDGLARTLEPFDVSPPPARPAQLPHVERVLEEEAGRWSLRRLIPGAGYVAAVAVDGHYRRLRCWQWA